VQACQINNGESPALSGDGTRLGFLREDRGRGSLWMTDLLDCGPGTKITPPSFDVRTLAAGPNNSFVMSAVYQGKERVFTVSPGAAPQLLAEAEGPLNSPAWSPDGRVLVVRELVSHRWQLASLDLSSRVWKQLTHGDCNAFTPSWKDDDRLLYATDCMRGMGLMGLASLTVERSPSRPQ
jgi:WD40 repeat protein